METERYVRQAVPKTKYTIVAETVSGWWVFYLECQGTRQQLFSTRIEEIENAGTEKIIHAMVRALESEVLLHKKLTKLGVLPKVLSE